MKASRSVRLQMRMLWRRLMRRASNPDRFPLMEILFATLALVLGLTSYAILAGRRAPAEGFSPQVVTMLLVANLVPLLALLLLIARRVALLRSNRRARVAGAQLHVRLIGLFATLAVAPTILTVIFASLLFQYGVQFWFSDRARTVLDNADRVAQAYVDEAKSRILDDIVAMGRDISSYSQDFGLASQSFQDGLAFQVAARNLTEAAVFQPAEGGPMIVAAAAMEGGASLGERIGSVDLRLVPPGQAVALTSANDRMEAVVRLETSAPLYVYVSRRVEPRVLQQVARTQAAISDYKALTDRSRDLQWRFNLILLVVSLLIVAAAIWFAILLATRIVAPIGELARAAERVGAGDFEARVKVQGTDEIGAMGRAFNRMTSELKAQQEALIDANTQSEARRRFTEAVLSGVSAGVMSIDSMGQVRLANARADTLLEPGAEGLAGRSLPEAVPEFAALFEQARKEGVAAAQISRARSSGEGETRTFAVRLTADTSKADSYVLTFDDISQQLVDQRRAAWSDVARRIAHEIKNPLTPIVLAAERLKRRFGKQIEDGRETYDELTETIIRQVGDLRRMVDEFSAFARMPAPVFQPENIADIARQAVFLAEVASPDISFSLDVAGDLPPFVCDRRQLGQAFSNLTKNAVEAIESREEDGEKKVSVAIMLCDGRLVVTISDTGVGVPGELRERLFEPYVTTRQRGTGLGLAIVKRIVEDHRGRLDIGNRRDGGGAVVRMEFDMVLNRALYHLAAHDRGVDHMIPESEQVS